VESTFTLPQIGEQTIPEDTIHRLGYHKVTEETLPKHAQVRRHFMWLDAWLLDNIPNTREMALARTALQEAAMWSNAAIACNLAPVVNDPGTFDTEGSS
jgi:hypothetical protein